MAGFSLSADLMRSLELRLEMYGYLVGNAKQEARDVVYTEVMKRAHASPRWVHVADFLDTWDENDRYWIGVRSPEFVSEAFAAEYGTDMYPPEPLMRTIDDVARIAANRSGGMLSAKTGGHLA